MFIWSPFPYIRYAIALIAGILCEQHEFMPAINLWHLAILFGLMSVCWVFENFSKPNETNRVLGGFFTLLTISAVGFLVSQFHDERTDFSHYSSYSEIKAFRGTVLSDNVERKDYQRYEVGIDLIKTSDSAHSASGRVYLYVRKEDSLAIYQYGDKLDVLAACHPVGAPGNPEEFDYRRYLETINIYAHAFASESDITLIENDPPNVILGTAFAIRTKCKELIFEQIDKEREQAILAALLIGIKDHLDNETKLAYSSAGAMHVLAVSGLHVGIVYLLINLVFGFVKKKKAGQIAFIVLAISLIWSYALVTGFSPSVLRASVMFSVILISQTISKSANIYNSLGIAAFVLLLYDPFLIHSVGFQLSFAAVFGIVFLQPKLVRLMVPNTKVMLYFWQITCVSISAQLATFPLTVYYFHQFPTYFLVSNIVVIPAAAVILVGGILLVTGSFIHTGIGWVIGFILGWFIWIINEAIGYLMLLPRPIVDWLYFDIYDTILVYAMILLFSIAFDYYHKRSLFAALICGMFLCAWLNYKHSVYVQQKRIVFYEIKNKIAIDLVDGKEATLLIDDLSEDELEVVGFQVNPFRLANGLGKMETSYALMSDHFAVQIFPYGKMIDWAGKKILILDTDQKLDFKAELYADIIYLNGTRYWSSEMLKGNRLILGADTQYYQLDALRDRLADSGISAHSLVEDGYYEIKL
ncbi:MAG: ComEC/Rec2 family competence protein [Cyclobacteriaceae bacterium]